MSLRGLRPISLLLAILGFESLWVAAAMVALGVGERGGALAWLPLFLVGAALLLWHRWLWTLDIWGSAVGWAASAGGSVLLLSLLMGGMAPTEVGGLLAGPGDWLRAARGLPFVLFRPLPLSAGLLAGLLLLYRAVDLVTRPLVGPAYVLGRLRLSLLLLVAAVVVLEGRGGTLPTSLVPPFFAFSLLALALARADELSNLPGVTSLPFSGRWAGNVLAAVAAVILLGSAATLLVAWDAGPLRQLLVLLLRSVLWIYAILAQIFAALFLPLVEPILRNVSLATPTPVPTESGPLAPPEAPPVLTGPVALSPYLLLLPALLVALYLLNRLGSRRRRRGSRANPEAEISQVATEGSVGDWLRRQGAALRGLFARDRQPFGLDTVQDLYKNLLLFGDEHGLARPVEQTPYEYLQPLCGRYPQCCADFYTLTHAYVAAHYGELRVTREEVESLRAAWHRIATAGSEGAALAGE